MRVAGLIAVAGMAAMLGACGKSGGGTPTGQVVATVDGEEITANELKMELGGARANDAVTQKQLERQALQAIVNRKLLAKAAHDQKLDQAPEFAMQKAKTDDMVAISALERKLASSVPAPSREEARQYVTQHPDSFAQRKLLLVDQVVAPGVPPAVVRQMQPLKTLEQVEQLLDQNKVPHQRAVGAIDGATTDPELIKKIVALPAGEVFIVPNAGGVLINHVRETRIDPFTGDRAILAAQQILRQRRTGEMVRNQMQQIAAAGAPSVKYNADYGPPAKAGAPRATAAPK